MTLLPTVQPRYTLMMGRQCITVPSRCSVGAGRLTVQPRALCDEHKAARAKELARLRARKAGDPTQALADPNATPITLTPSEIRLLANYTIDLLDKENAVRTWAAGLKNQHIPPAVGESIKSAVRVRKALSRLIELNLE